MGRSIHGRDGSSLSTPAWRGCGAGNVGQARMGAGRRRHLGSDSALGTATNKATLGLMTWADGRITGRESAGAAPSPGVGPATLQHNSGNIRVNLALDVTFTHLGSLGQRGTWPWLDRHALQTLAGDLLLARIRCRSFSAQ
jgi:hypothetical protein